MNWDIFIQWNTIKYWNVQTTHNMDEFHKYNVEQKKPDLEEFLTSDSVYIECKNRQK